MNVFFTPYFSNNPYQKKLIEELALLKITVNIALTGSNAFFKTKDIYKADIIHFHWFEPFIKSKSFIKSFIKMFTFLVRLFIFKKDKRFVWTVHNLVNHEKKNVLVDKMFLFFFIKMIDVICVHNNFAKQELIKKYSVNPRDIKIIAHGNYANDYTTFNEDVISFKKNVMHIDCNKKTFTFLGHIRPYKGVLDLIKAFKSSKDERNSQLLICGKVSSKEDLDLIEEEILGTKNIIFKPGYVEEEHIAGYIKCSDIMIYPYKNILTSGALILGMSMKKTCIASNVGSMAEFLDRDFIFNNVDELSRLIKKLENKSTKDLESTGYANFDKIKNDTWKNMAKKLKEVYL